MRLRLRKTIRFGVLAAVALAALHASPVVAAITLGHLDDFQDGTAMDWRVGQTGFSVPTNVANAGPLSFGDRALYSKSGEFGAPGRLVLLNESNAQFPGEANWEGDWTAAGITKVALDVRNPATGAGAIALTIRLGIAGPGGAGAFGDVYVTEGMSVPPDNLWYSLIFDVLPADFTVPDGGSGTDVVASLADVTQFRIIHSQFAQFTGDDATTEIFIDNIHALGPLPGDYNGDDAVDAADYVVWRDLNGQSGPGLAADGTGPTGDPDGIVNILDYEFWRAHFGQSYSDGGHNHGSGANLAAVPEPATALLCGAGVFGFLAAYRRMHRCQEPAN